MAENSSVPSVMLLSIIGIGTSIASLPGQKVKSCEIPVKSVGSVEEEVCVSRMERVEME